MSREAINIIIIIVGAVIIIIFDFIFNIIVGFIFTIFSGEAGVRWDSMRLLQLGSAVGRDSMAAGVEYHGGLGGIGIKNAMVNIVSLLC